ncbi:cupin domain-containing protein [Microvirga aerophila]|uniref:Cupin n=2 Tax=Microvirga aerophila TaxID=670291 RepID=A0A512BZ00_9HYPH|nr:cupin domain-containing protein [Microvirga aerophila]GEO17196.1 cupin [Microvirga aerophila]
MATRRVVTGTVNGKAVFLSDGPVPTEHEYQTLPGHRTSICWATLKDPSSEPVTEAAPVGVGALPLPGETRLLIVHFPPASVMFGPGFDPAGADSEQRKHLPGLAETFEPDAPGMHRTCSVDYNIVLDGSIWLELDDGNETMLNQGDVVIQQATRHAWRNKGDRPATMAFVLVGASESR